MASQRGVDLPSLDVAYFTSLSYYILLLFGLRGVFMLFFREATIDETQMYRQQMGMGGGAGANPMAAMAGGDPTKALEAERAALELVRAECRVILGFRIWRPPCGGLIRHFHGSHGRRRPHQGAGGRPRGAGAGVR